METFVFHFKTRLSIPFQFFLWIVSIQCVLSSFILSPEWMDFRNRTPLSYGFSFSTWTSWGTCRKSICTCLHGCTPCALSRTACQQTPLNTDHIENVSLLDESAVCAGSVFQVKQTTYHSDCTGVVVEPRVIFSCELSVRFGLKILLNTDHN